MLAGAGPAPVMKPGVSVSINAFKDQLRLSMRARVPTFIWGPPGVGKTASVEGAGAEDGMLVYTLIGSTCDPTDINGMPVMVAAGTHPDGRTKYALEFAPRTWVRELNEAPRGGALFIDEYTNSPGDVRAALLRGIQHGIFGDSRLDLDRVAIIAAGNPPEMCPNGHEMDPPTANRFTHLHYPHGPDAAREWTEQFPAYWNNPPVIKFRGKVLEQEDLIRARSAVAGFLRKKPDLWFAMPKETSKRAEPWASPRSWDAVSRFVALALADKKEFVDVHPLMAGAVGEGAAGEFLTHIKEESLPDPDHVLANADTYTPTGRVDVDFSVLMSVAAAVRAKPTPDRYMQAWVVVGDRAMTKRGDKVPSYEAATAAAKQLGLLLKEQPDKITGKIPKDKLNAYVGRLSKFMSVYRDFLKKVGVEL